MPKKIKYIHIMSHESTVYNAQIVNMINENEESFSKENHLFVISNSQVYNQVKHFENVKFEPNISKSISVLKKYAKECDYIFLHSNTLSAKVLLFSNKNILNKIVWCEWGHDLYDKNENSSNIIRLIAKKIIRGIPKFIKKIRTKKYYAVGIGFQYDAIEAKRKFGKDMRIVMTPYGYTKDNKEKIDMIIEENKNNNHYTKIMVGHSAYPFLNHIELLNKLAKYKEENIKISLVLAYGSKEYAETVKSEAKKLFDDNKIEIIQEMMSQEEYIKYLTTVDICCLDYKHQAALANIYMLLYMGKKLFLNRDGIVKLFTTLENIETYNTNDIGHIQFSEFKTPIKNTNYGKQFAEFHIDEKNYISLWKITIKDLERNNK